MKNGAFARFWALCAGILLTAGLIGCGGDGDDANGSTDNGKPVEMKSMAITLPKTYKGPQIDSSVTPENGGIGFDSIAEAERRITAEMVTNGAAGTEAVEAWVKPRANEVERIRAAVGEMSRSALTISKLSVAASLVGDLVKP